MMPGSCSNQVVPFNQDGDSLDDLLDQIKSPRGTVITPDLKKQQASTPASTIDRSDSSASSVVLPTVQTRCSVTPEDIARAREAREAAAAAQKKCTPQARPTPQITEADVNFHINSVWGQPEASLAFLRQACRTSAGQKLVMEAGGIEVGIGIVKALKDMEVLQLALSALEAFVMLNSEAQKRATDAGASEVLLDELKHAKTPELTSAICGTLSVLCYRSDRTICTLMALRAEQAVLDALNRYPEDASVQKAGFGALYRLAYEDDAARLQVFACDGLYDAVERAAVSGYADEAHWFRMKAGDMWPSSESTSA